MTGLHPGPGDPVRAGRGRMVLAGGLLLPRRPQVQVILQQLPLHVPAPLGQQVFEPARGQPGRRSGLQLFHQRDERIHGGREGAGTLGQGIRFHKGSSFCPVRFGRHLRT